jgi:hypothetical protein
MREIIIKLKIIMNIVLHFINTMIKNQTNYKIIKLQIMKKSTIFWKSLQINCNNFLMC